jgi:hypothetical protein
VCPVLDGLLIEPFADPTSDSTLSEVMCIESIRLDSSCLTNALDSATQILISERSVRIIPDLAEFVNQRDIEIVAPRMDIQPVCNVSVTEGEWNAATSVLYVSIFVDRDSCDPSRKVDISDSETCNSADPHTSIGKEGDSSLVTGVISRFENLIYFIHSEHFLRVNVSVRTTTKMNIICPIGTLPAEEFPPSFLVVSECASCQSVIVFESGSKIIEITIIRRLNQRSIPSLSTQSKSIDIADDRSNFDFSSSVGMLSEVVDRLTIGITYVSRFQFFKLVIVLVFVILNVGYIRHTNYVGHWDYVDMDSSSPGTILSERSEDE